MSRNRLILAIEPVLPRRLPEEPAKTSRGAVLRVAARAAQRFVGWSPSAEDPMETIAPDNGRMLLLGPSPRLALRACLYLRAQLWVSGRDMDLRIGAGIGRANIVGDVDLRPCSGPAFDAAETALASLDRVQRMAPGWPEPPVHAARTRALFVLADAVARRWTVTQADLARDLLDPAPDALDRFAAASGRERRSVLKSWQDSGGWAVDEALKAFEGER